MKIGVNLLNFGPGVSPEALAGWTQLAETLGYHFVMISDHVAMTPDVVARYPAPYYDPFVTLAWLLFKLPKFEHVIAYINAMIHSRAVTNYSMVAHVITYSLPVILYYAWYLLKQRWDKVRRYEFLLFAILLAAIILDSGTTGTFIYFQF